MSTIIHIQESETHRSEMKMTCDKEPLKLSGASITQIGSTPSSRLEVHLCQENGENVVKEVGAIYLTMISEVLIMNVCLCAILFSVLLFYVLPLNYNKEQFIIVEECYFSDAHAKINKGVKGLFSMSAFISAACKIPGSQIFLKEEVIKSYLESILKLHCLRLCLNEPGTQPKEQISRCIKLWFVPDRILRTI